MKQIVGFTFIILLASAASMNNVPSIIKNNIFS